MPYRRRIVLVPQFLRRKIRRFYREFRLTVDSLTYNYHMDSNYATDVVMEPIFWIVDNFSGALGKFFIVAVPTLIAYVVIVAYWLGLPYWWERSPTVTVFLVVVGHWLLINVAFHYYKAVTTSPGESPEDYQIVEAASICKRCISPRPPRAHHCSVCNTCILCMDHHCPWLNNCVGHYNRRYFYLYMIYIVIGAFFVILAGLDIGYVVLWIGDTTAIPSDNEAPLVGHSVHVNNSGVFIPLTQVQEYDSVILPRDHVLPVPKITFAQKIAANTIMRRAVTYTAVLNLAVIIAVGVLAICHGKLVNKGETSIESHINQADRKKLGASFRNPYDFGWKKNWKLFLGLVGQRSFFFHVILPSSHPPVGDGLVWHTVHDKAEDWP